MDGGDAFLAVFIAGVVGVTVFAAAFDYVDYEADEGVESVAGDGIHFSWDTVTLVATVREGYVFEGWYSEDGELLTESAAVTLEADDVCLTARTHREAKVRIALTAGDGVARVSGAGTYESGTSVKLSASVKEGYHFTGWYDDDGVLVSSSENAIVRASDMTLTATAAFGTLVELRLTGDTGIASIEGSGMYEKGRSATVKANLSPGYSFDGWYDLNGKLISISNVFVLDLNEDTVLQAQSIPEYTIKLIGMPGSFVKGGGTFSSNRTACLVADPQNKHAFDGWYDLDGQKLSADLKYTPEKHDAVIIAKTTYQDFSGTNKLKYSFPNWYDENSYCIVTDFFSGSYVMSFKGRHFQSIPVSGGRFCIDYYNGCYDKTEKHETDTQSFDGENFQRFRWEHEGKDYSMVWTTYYKNFKYYEDRNYHILPYGTRLISKYVDYDSEIVKLVTNFLLEQSEGMSRLERAQFVLDFVQQTTVYEYDKDYNGQNDYWKYPFETLLTHRGDCEDTSFLFLAIMKGMGYDVAALDFDDHMAAGVNVKGAHGTYFEHDGVKYFCCETTSNTDIGVWNWDGYDSAEVVVIRRSLGGPPRASPRRPPRSSGPAPCPPDPRGGRTRTPRSPR